MEYLTKWPGWMDGLMNGSDGMEWMINLKFKIESNIVIDRYYYLARYLHTIEDNDASQTNHPTNHPTIHQSIQPSIQPASHSIAQSL